MSAADHEVAVDAVFGCWVWTGKVDRHGYGVVLRRGKAPRSAHRYVWTKERGEVPKGLVLDHACRNRLCCNPAHLEVVDQSENERRKSFRYRCKRKTCAKGHDLKLFGMVTPEAGKVCRICSKETR